MKKLFLVLGILMVLYSIATLIQNVNQYSNLPEYEKGAFWGKAILLIIGSFLIYKGVKKNPSNNTPSS
ncbi:MAG: hypothetical protein P1U56_05675 [Saprospiraceae bacterium]|nr:hypothetical protein [Saprospiraceae bacterium]